MELTKTELAAVRGVVARDRLLQQDMKALGEEYQGVLAEIATRFGLTPTAFGTTHDIDIEQGTVRARPEPEPQKQTAEAPATSRLQLVDASPDPVLNGVQTTP